MNGWMVDEKQHLFLKEHNKQIAFTKTLLISNVSDMRSKMRFEILSLPTKYSGI